MKKSAGTKNMRTETGTGVTGSLKAKE